MQGLASLTGQASWTIEEDKNVIELLAFHSRLHTLLVRLIESALDAGVGRGKHAGLTSVSIPCCVLDA